MLTPDPAGHGGRTASHRHRRPSRPERRISQRGAGAEAAKDLLAQMSSMVPLGRVGQPSEIAAAATFLASDDSSFVNGSELFVDGGMAQV
jgi:NAD(P)-dependent dehydrogenase (short-subunit alcohol dehydrogenase family)